MLNEIYRVASTSVEIFVEEISKKNTRLPNPVSG